LEAERQEKEEADIREKEKLARNKRKSNQSTNQSTSAGRSTEVGANDSTDPPETDLTGEDDDPAGNGLLLGWTRVEGRKSSVFWTHFTYQKVVNGVVTHVRCDLCFKSIKYNNNTSALRTHTMAQHQEEFDLLVAEDKKKKAEQALGHHPTVASGSVGRTETVFSQARKTEADRRAAIWVARQCQPVTIFEEPVFKCFLEYISNGAYSGPSHHLLGMTLRELRAVAVTNTRKLVTELKVDNVEPTLITDIWSENGLALLGICLIYIDRDMNIKEVLVRATPMTELAHTAENI